MKIRVYRSIFIRFTFKTLAHNLLCYSVEKAKVQTCFVGTNKGLFWVLVIIATTLCFD